jgi:hypothetical protein
MNLNRRICYGVLKISRQTARRERAEWSLIESPSHPTQVSSAASPFRPPEDFPPTKEKRLWAA